MAPLAEAGTAAVAVEIGAAGPPDQHRPRPRGRGGGKTIDDPRFTIRHAAFADMADELCYRRAGRGRRDVGPGRRARRSTTRSRASRSASRPLDMRMDTTRGESAAEFWRVRASAKSRRSFATMEKNGLLHRLQRRLLLGARAALPSAALPSFPSSWLAPSNPRGGPEPLQRAFSGTSDSRQCRA